MADVNDKHADYSAGAQASRWRVRYEEERAKTAAMLEALKALAEVDSRSGWNNTPAPVVRDIVSALAKRARDAIALAATEAA